MRYQHLKFLSQFSRSPSDTIPSLSQKADLKPYFLFERMLWNLYRLQPEKFRGLAFQDDTTFSWSHNEKTNTYEYQHPLLSIKSLHTRYRWHLLDPKMHLASDCHFLDMDPRDYCDENWHDVKWRDSGSALEASQKVLQGLSALAAPYNAHNRIALILEWMQKHPGYLREEVIQKYLFQRLLSGDSIPITYSTAPYVIDNLRLYVKKNVLELEQSNPRSRSQICFWLRLGYFIETRLIECKDPQTFSIYIPLYQEIALSQFTNCQLATADEAELKLLWILFHEHCEISVDQGELFIKHLLRVNDLMRQLKFAPETSDSSKHVLEKLELLRLEASRTMRLRKDLLCAKFNALNIKEWLQQCDVKGLPDKSVRGNFPLYRINGQPLDLLYGDYEAGTIQDHKDEWKRIFLESETIKKALGISDHIPVELDLDNKEMRDLDHTFHCYTVPELPVQPLSSLNKELIPKHVLDEFLAEHERINKNLSKSGQSPMSFERRVITKKITLANTTRDFEYIKANTLTSALPNILRLKKKHTHWLSLEDKNKRYIVILENHRIPKARIEPIEGEEGKFICHRLDKKGEFTGEVLVSDITPLKDILSQFWNEKCLDEMLVWAKGGVVTCIEFPRFSLTFTPSSNQKGIKLVSQEHPGYCLLPYVQKCHSGLGDLAILLGKSNGDLFAMIQAPEKIELPFQLITLYKNKRRNHLEASSWNQQLCFITHLIEGKHYLKALKAIESSKPRLYGTTSYVILDNAFNLVLGLNSDPPTAESILVILHLLLHFHDSRLQYFNGRIPPGCDSTLYRQIVNAVDMLKVRTINDVRFALDEHQKALLRDLKLPDDFDIEALPVTISPTLHLHHEFDWYEYPLKDLKEALYEEDSRTDPPSSFVLDPQLIPKDNPLAKALYDNLAQAHLNNPKTHCNYTPKCSPKEIKEKLKGQIGADKEQFSKLYNLLMAKANIGLKSFQIDLNDQIYCSLVHRSAHLLTAINPHLTPDGIEEVWELAIQCMLVQTRIDQASQALCEVKKLGSGLDQNIAAYHQVIGKILSKQRLYKPWETPQYLLYEYATEKFLRPEQMKLLNWILSELKDHDQVATEFQAGGGKTQVITPLICHAAVQQKLLPIFFSLPAMYDVVKQDLGDSLTTAFDIKPRILEISLDTKLGHEELGGIYNLLTSWRDEGAALVITPVVFHKLHLCLYQHLDEPNSPAQQILEFLKSYGLFIVDEAHRNLISTWQAIVALDETPCLDPQEQRLFITIYKLLMGVIPCSLKSESGKVMALSEYVQLKQDGQSSLNKEQRRICLKTVATWLCQNVFKIDPGSQEEAVIYLCNPKTNQPPWLANWDQKQTFLLARGLLTKILKVTLKMMHQFDYGAPIPPYTVEMPRFLKMPTGAQFADPDLAAALTCQGLYQRGLEKSQFQHLLHALVEQHNKEKQRGDSQRTPTALLLYAWQRQANITTPFFIGNLNSQEDIDYLHELLKGCPAVIEHYLGVHLLPKVKRYAHQMSSTAADMSAGGYKTVLFSATLGMPEEYPAIRDITDKGVQRSHLPDFRFQSAVIAEACEPHNATMHWLDPSLSPFDFFKQLHECQGSSFTQLEGIIDVAGWHRHASTEEMALAFLNYSREKQLGYQGTLFIRENAGGSSAFCLILDQDGNNEYLEVQGSDFLTALKRKGYRTPEDVRIFKIFGPSQATGIDMYLTNHAKMLITLGSKSSLWDQIQAIMRCRRFLEPAIEGSDMQQSLVWVGPKPLREKIQIRFGCELKDIDVKYCLHWCLEVEVKGMEPRIILQACQSILQVIRGVLEQKLKTEGVWALQHKEGIFIESIERDLCALYAYSTQKESAKDVLTLYFKDILQTAQLDEKDIPLLQIQAIIHEAEQKVAKISAQVRQSTTSTLQAQKQQHQHIQIGQQQRRNTENSKPSQDPVALPISDYASTSLRCAQLPLSMHDHLLSANQIFSKGGTFFYNHLYLLSNVYHTKQQSDFSLKQIDFFLLVLKKQENGWVPHIYCVSHQDAQAYANQLESGESNPNCQTALCTSLGQLAQNSNLHGIDKDVWENLTRSPFWNEVIHQIALLNGEVNDIEYFETHTLPAWKGDVSSQQISAHLDDLCAKQLVPEEADKAIFERVISSDPAPLGPSEPISVNAYQIPSEPSQTSLQDPIQEITARPLPPTLPPFNPRNTKIPQMQNQQAQTVETISADSSCTNGKIAVVIAFCLGLIILSIGGMSMLGGYWSHAPHWCVTLYNFLPHWATYGLLSAGGALMLPLPIYAIYQCCKTEN